jgi:hypothetical protein
MKPGMRSREVSKALLPLQYRPNVGVGKFLYMNDDEISQFMASDLKKYEDGNYYFTYVKSPSPR